MSESAETAVLRVRDVAKAYGDTKALRGVSVEFQPRSIHALLGGNGSGKSTFIKVLAGVVAADAGSIEMHGRSHDAKTQTPALAREMGLRFVHQQESTFPDLTVAENLALGRGFEHGPSGRIHWRALRRRAAEVLERLDIPVSPDRPLRMCGPATQMMIAIARALQDEEGSEERAVLVLDEPTSSLPGHEVELLLEALQRYAAQGSTIVYVTHRLEEVLQVADRATVLRDGALVETLERDALNHEQLVELIMGRSITPLRATREPGGRSGESSKPVLELRGFSSERQAITIRSGEVVGVAGLLGSGRTRLLRTLFGLVPRVGDVEVLLDGEPVAPRTTGEAMRCGFGYIPEDRAAEGIFADLSISRNLSIASLSDYSRRGKMSQRAEVATTKKQIEALSIKASGPQARLSSLSGGNQQKVVMARWLLRQPRVLLLDEPTQGVDVGARTEIHQLIRAAVDAGACALVVCSDFEELALACDRAIVVRNGVVAEEIAGVDLNEEILNHAVYGTRPAGTTA